MTTNTTPASRWRVTLRSENATEVSAEIYYFGPGGAVTVDTPPFRVFNSPDNRTGRQDFRDWLDHVVSTPPFGALPFPRWTWTPQSPVWTLSYIVDPAVDVLAAAVADCPDQLWQTVWTTVLDPEDGRWSLQTDFYADELPDPDEC